MKPTYHSFSKITGNAKITAQFLSIEIQA